MIRSMFKYAVCIAAYCYTISVLGQTPEEAVPPQTPLPPFPYTQEPVTYAGGDTAVQLSATLYLPEGVQYPPVALLLPGTGPQDRSATMGRHAYYNVIIDYLCRQGIGVLWADDRGVGASTGNFDQATTQDFARDAVAGVTYLKARRDVDIHHIGIIGHSEGGTMACMAAAMSADVSFVVSLSGQMVPGLQAVTEQNEAIVNQTPISAEEKALYNSINNRMFQAIYKNAYQPQLDSAMVSNLFYAWKKEQSLELLTKTRMDSHQGDRYLRAFQQLIQSPWYLFMITYDPARAVEKITAPVLAINGTEDIMVQATSNLAVFQKHLPNPKQLTVHKMQGLNHMLQHCHTCTQQEYTQLDETIAPEVLRLIAVWIKGHIKA